MRLSARSQRGFTMVTTLFLLVVLAALGGYMATMSGVQHTTPAFSVLGARAHFAARSGIEWAVHDIVNNGAANLDCGPGTTSFTVTGYDVSVSCTSQNVTEGSRTYTMYELGSTATQGSPGDADFASRTILATIAF